jgi:hypothetical protein
MAFEEVVDLGKSSGDAAAAPEVTIGFGGALNENNAGDRNYLLIAQLYQQLQKNYDDHGDYWTAGDFHYGDMEMKRLATRRHNAILRALHRRVGLVALYRYASQYGESYDRPAVLLMAIILFFTFLYAAVGLQHPSVAEQAAEIPAAKVPTTPKPATAAAARPAGMTVTTRTTEVSYWNACPNCGRSRIVTAQLRLLGNSLMTALSVSAFDKDLVYKPSYPWGRVLALIQVLITSALLALFLLALNRQFRR